jgi:hypothetical protein
MSGLHKAKKSKKLRKCGRNAAYCLAYKNSNRREKNKVKKLLKHLAKFSNDNCAKVSLGNTKVLLGYK